MERLERICKNDPTALDMLEKIMDDMIRAADEQVRQLELLYVEVVQREKGK